MVFAEPNSDRGGVSLTGWAELSSSYSPPVIRLALIRQYIVMELQFPKSPWR